MKIAAAEWHGAYRTGFTALRCTDTEHCWAVGGARGAGALETTDGGKSWMSRVSGTGRHKRLPTVVPSLYSAIFPDRINGWLTGHDSLFPVGGLILHSSDGGSIWADQSSGTKAALLSVGFCNGQSGWAVGSSWTILHTSDAGQS
jgi:photosystem II stability/assembly factor-like uncharacterized protein